MSEALIFADHGENMLWTEIVLNVKDNFCTHHFLPMFWAWNFHVLNLKFNEQSVVILWVSWFENKSLWQRFTCTGQWDPQCHQMKKTWISSNPKIQIWSRIWIWDLDSCQIFFPVWSTTLEWAQVWPQSKVPKSR